MQAPKNCMHNWMLMQYGKKLHAHAIVCQIACAWNCACNFWVHAIFGCMQLCQYGCRSTRLDFRNDVLGDEYPKNDSIVYCTMKLRLDFLLYYFELPLYFWNGCFTIQINFAFSFIVKYCISLLTNHNVNQQLLYFLYGQHCKEEFFVVFLLLLSSFIVGRGE